MQRKLKITSDDLKLIRLKKSEEVSAKIFKRLLALELRATGMKCKEVAELLGVCIDTISDWSNLFVEGGIELLCSLNYESRRASKLEPYKSSMIEQVKNNTVSTLAQMQSWLKETYNIEVEESWLYRFCKKNSVFPTKKHD